MKHKIYINKKAGKTNFGPIYSENKDCGDMEEVVLNHTIDKTNPSVCLNIMMVVGDYSKEEIHIHHYLLFNDFIQQTTCTYNLWPTLSKYHKKRYIKLLPISGKCYRFLEYL